ncbi:MAG TPA: hypothetical protein EYQ00_04720, partial [Dehalococcoidia bacterium]|nr:hypothetical protein [Dehalococcoidia bacterium]
MKRDDDDALKIGASYLSDNEPDGQMSDFAMWSGYALGAADVKAIYNITKHDHGTVSGIISNPVRIMLQDRDHRTGSYPTISRTGDPDFTGEYSSFYDDTNTLIFNSQDLVYPTGLPTTSKFVSGGVASPNILQGLIAPGTSSAGISDSHIRFTPGENITPFNESRVYLDNDSEFYATGTAPETLPGFAQRLLSKAILTFDISPTSGTEVYFSTGTAPSATGINQRVNSGLSYFNFLDKRWEIIGDLTTESNVDYYTGSHAMATGSMLAIANNSWWHGYFPSVDFGPIARGLAGPTTFAGFPFASKFNATGSQHLTLSSSVTAPFLVEKWELDIS